MQPYPTPVLTRAEVRQHNANHRRLVTRVEQVVRLELERANARFNTALEVWRLSVDAPMQGPTTVLVEFADTMRSVALSRRSDGRWTIDAGGMYNATAPSLSRALRDGINEFARGIRFVRD